MSFAINASRPASDIRREANLPQFRTLARRPKAEVQLCADFIEKLGSSVIRVIQGAAVVNVYLSSDAPPRNCSELYHHHRVRDLLRRGRPEPVRDGPREHGRQRAR